MAAGGAAIVIGTVLPSYGIQLHPAPNLDFVGPERLPIVGGIDEPSISTIATALHQWSTSIVAILSTVVLAWGPRDARQIARGGVAAAGVISGLAAVYWSVTVLVSDRVWFAPIYILLAGHVLLLLGGIVSLSGSREHTRGHVGQRST